MCVFVRFLDEFRVSVRRVVCVVDAFGTSRGEGSCACVNL